MQPHRAALSLAIALAALLCGVRALVASNMGFVVNCPLTAAGPGSRSGTNTLNLPYQRDAQLLSAARLFTDLGLSNVAVMYKFLEASDGLQFYTGRKGSAPDFALPVGDGIVIKMNASVNYVVGGSSDPQIVLSLDGPGVAHLTGTNLVGLPYHSTAHTASALMQDIGFANVANVQRFVTETDGPEIYTGRKGSPPDFPLDPCESYFIKMSTTVNYIPSHY